MIKFLFFQLSLLITTLAFSQQVELKGLVSDESNVPLAGVHVKIDSQLTAVSNEDGLYSVILHKGEHTVAFSYIGFEEEIFDLNLQSATKTLDVTLKASAQLVGGIVVSAGRYQQNLNEVPVSMEVISAKTVEQLNPRTMDEALAFVPGVSIADGQISIRGGSGYSYGAGSRVMVLVDGLPMLSPDAGDTKWNFIPLDNLSQVEVVKGASSSTYGSSALNGVVNILTAFPGPKPETTINTFTGFYLAPEREELKWWGDDLQFFTGSNVSHSQQIGQIDLVTSANLYHNAGYRTSNNEDRFGYHLKLRYRHPKIKGLSFGLSSSVLYQDKTDFFLWKADTAAYKQNESTLNPSKGHRFVIDPYVTFYDKTGAKHQLKTRFFNLKNNIEGDEKDNSADLYFGEYQYSKQFKNKLRLTTGTSIAQSYSHADLFGDHASSNFSIFAQVEQRILKRLILTAGVRWEHFILDEQSESTDPLLRFGANYSIFDHSFLRASYGQGHRYPTIAEKYTYTKVGSIQILPNPRIESETGWSAEIGLKQEFKLSDWRAFIDVAAFVTEYHNMMEFTFGTFDSLTFVQLFDEMEQIGQPFGFQSQNVSEAKISGYEVSFGIDGQVGAFPVSMLAGYTFTNPIDLNTDSVYNSWKSGDSNLLKYRYKHAFSLIANIQYRRLALGVSMLHNSHIENIDRFFEFSFVLPGLKEYREENNTGFWRTDFSLAYDATKQMTLSLQLKNALNREYMIRPGDVAAPRNITFQMLWKI